MNPARNSPKPESTPGLHKHHLREVLRTQVTGKKSLIRLSVDLVNLTRQHGLNGTEAGCLFIALGCQLLDEFPDEAVKSLMDSAAKILTEARR